MKTFTKILAAGALATMIPLSAAAQQAGMNVVDTQGNAVGVVVTADDQFVTVRTDKHDIPVPVASFTPNDGKLLFAMSAADLNASYEKALADTEASVAVGASVVDVDGTAAGMIDEKTAEYVQIEVPSGKVVRIPPEGLQKNAGGAILLYKVADLEAQAIERPPEAAEEALEAAEMAEEAAGEAVEAAEAAVEAADGTN